MREVVVDAEERKLCNPSSANPYVLELLAKPKPAISTHPLGPTRPFAEGESRAISHARQRQMGSSFALDIFLEYSRSLSRYAEGYYKLFFL